MIANDMRHALPIRAVQALVLCILLSLSGVAFAAEDLVAPVPLSDFGSAWTYEIGQAGGSLSEVEERLQAQEARPAPFIGVHDGDKKDKNTKNKKRAKDDKKARDEETRFELDKDWVFDESSESSLANQEVLWLSQTFEFSAEQIESLRLEARFLNGFVVYLNGQELLRHGLALEGRGRETLGDAEALGIREGRERFNQRIFRGLDPTPLLQGQNRLTVRVHRRLADNPWVYFDLRLEAFTEKGFVKTPYLQNPGAEAITVMFESTVLSTPYVEYGVGTELTEVATNPSTGGTLHEVTLTHLMPDTTYFYRVRAEKLWPPLHDDESSNITSPVYFFRTAPTGTGPFTFIAYGDNRSQPVVHAALIEKLLAEPASFAINTGDLTETGIEDQRWQDEFFAPALPLMHYLPIWTTLGNHDGNHVSYYELFSLPGNESWYQFEYGSAEFFSLNSTEPMEPESPQLLWLEQALAHSTARWKIVFLHHPAFACTEARLPGYAPVRDYAVPLFEQYSVDLVLAGHDHLYGRGELNGVDYVITGGGGAWTYPPTVREPNTLCVQQHHYLVIDVDEDLLRIRAINIDGEEIDSFAIAQ